MRFSKLPKIPITILQEMHNSDAKVLIALANRLPNIWPSINRIALDTGLGRRTIIRSLQNLERLKIIIKQKRAGTSSKYSFYYSQEVVSPMALGSATGGTPPSATHGTLTRRSLTRATELAKKFSLKSFIEHAEKAGIKDLDQDRLYDLCYKRYNGEQSAFNRTFFERLLFENHKNVFEDVLKDVGYK